MDKSPKTKAKNELKAYYRIPTVRDNDFYVTDRPFCINCTGYSQYNCTVCGDSLRKDYYCIYLIQGKIEVKYPFQQTMHPGELVIFAPGTPYAYTGLKPFSYHWIHFSGSCVEQFLADCDIKLNEVMHTGISESALICLQKIKNEFKNRELFWESTATAECIRFFAQMGKALCGNSKTANHTAEMEKAAAYIQAHIGSEISVHTLAKKHHMSVSSFRSKFKEYAGMPPREYINTVRLGEAMHLLAATDTAIENIASTCGYHDPMYFSRIFRKKTGRSPRAYRKTMTQ